MDDDIKWMMEWDVVPEVPVEISATAREEDESGGLSIGIFGYLDSCAV